MAVSRRFCYICGRFISEKKNGKLRKHYKNKSLGSCNGSGS